MGSSQCFSDQRFAICCLWLGVGNVRASLSQKKREGPGVMCCRPSVCYADLINFRQRDVQKAPSLVVWLSSLYETACSKHQPFGWHSIQAEP
jgi:hypothetical protein